MKNNVIKEREELYKKIDKVYNNNISLLDNLNLLKSEGIDLSRSSLYNYTINRNIDTNYYREVRRKRVLELYDCRLSKEENLQILKQNGIDICKSYLNILLQKDREKNIFFSNDKTTGKN